MIKKTRHNQKLVRFETPDEAYKVAYEKAKALLPSVVVKPQVLTCANGQCLAIGQYFVNDTVKIYGAKNTCRTVTKLEYLFL